LRRIAKESPTLALFGYFRDFGREKKDFVFVDTEHDQVLEGAISNPVIEENQPITVHEDSRYVIVMERQMVTTRDGKTLRRHVLFKILGPSERPLVE
jgi:hypothetical protein